jgi:bacillithiol biosynthesis cysteine-adding enzyme BshC
VGSKSETYRRGQGDRKTARGRGQAVDCASIAPDVASFTEPHSGPNPEYRRYPGFHIEPQVNQLLTSDCYPLSVVPGMSRLFVDFCAGRLRDFLPGDQDALAAPPRPDHWEELVELLAAQNPSSSAAPALDALRQGGGTVVTGQQVGLFGGPLFTPLKAATALAMTRRMTAGGKPHSAIFWLAAEDHDFAEINHVVFPAGKELRTLNYVGQEAPGSARPVGGIALDESILPAIEQAGEILGASPTTEAIAAAYRPGRTLAQAFADFYGTVFANHGLLLLDASGRAFHRMGAPVLRAALERADELHEALLERNRALEAVGYHTQVAVTEQSSLLFLMDDQTGARIALKRSPASAQEPDGHWQSGQQSYSTAELVGILDAEPERISPSALLRPIFQDYLLGSSAVVGGPAEIAYFAQSGVLYERILGRQTPAAPRLAATLIEPPVAALLEKHELSVRQIWGADASSLAQRLAERTMPAEGKQRMDAASAAFEEQLDALVGWMQAMDQGLGQSAETAAGKMRYQMERLRRMAENFQLQRESSLGRHAQTLCNAIFPDGEMQERVHGAAYYFARHGMELANMLVEQAAAGCAGHLVLEI